MKASDIPTRFPAAFASQAVGGDVRAIPLTTADPNAASLQAGFPPNTFTPISAGGAPPDGRDFNGILLQTTQWSQWQNAGAPVTYNAAFSTAIGGYPSGAMLAAATAGYFWYSLVDDNTSDPDTGGANWSSFSPLGGFTTGDVKMSLKTAADPGWIAMNDGSIGSAASGATTLAGATALPLYTLIWNNVVNTWAPVSGGRGANAAADFAANKTLTLTKSLGRALAVAGTGAGLTARALGSNLGEETHAQTTPELAPHHHTVAFSQSAAQAGSGEQDLQAGGATDTSTTGSGTPFNVMQPTTFLNLFVKL